MQTAILKWQLAQYLWRTKRPLILQIILKASVSKTLSKRANWPSPGYTVGSFVSRFVQRRLVIYNHYKSLQTLLEFFEEIFPHLVFWWCWRRRRVSSYTLGFGWEDMWEHPHKAIRYDSHTFILINPSAQFHMESSAFTMLQHSFIQDLTLIFVPIFLYFKPKQNARYSVCLRVFVCCVFDMCTCIDLTNITTHQLRIPL